MWPFKKAEVKPERQEPVVPKRGFFTTDHIAALPDHAQFNQDNAFQKTAADFYVSAGEGADSADLSSLKSAFTLGQSGINQMLLSWYISQGFIGHQACALLAQHWLIDKACAQPPRDAYRHGFKISVNDGNGVNPDVLAAFDEANKKYNIKKQLEEFSRFNRVFGVRIALFLVDSTDPMYYEKPFNPDGVTPNSYKGISQIDPYWITPELDMSSTSNPASKFFYEPTYWRINGKRYHRSHLAIIRFSEVPDILKPSYLYGGVPLTQMIYERVYAAERTANEAPQLAMTKRTTTLHTNVDEALANQSEFESKLLTWSYYRDNFGVKVLGTDETMEQFDTSLSELDTVIMTQYQIVSAIARTPATKLLGTSPKGFNATGGFEESSYHEELESIQAHEGNVLLERHLLLVMRSDVAPKLGIQPCDVTIVWNKVDAQTEAEKAQTNLAKAQAYSTLAQAGAVDGTDIRQVVIADPESGFNIIDDSPQDDDMGDIQKLADLLNSEPTNGNATT